MRKLFALLGFMLVTACITVDDFGEYWDKGGYDVDIVGKWKEKDGSKVWTIRQFEKGYKISHGDEVPDEARTLTVGTYRYLMMRVKEGKPEGGVLVRYTRDKQTAKIYGLASGDKVNSWIEKYYPNQKQFKSQYSKDGLSIKTIDPEVIKMLADMPDNADYWEVIGEYIKVE